MKHFYISTSYIDASAKLDKACEWLEGLGINYSPTRIGRYKNLFSVLAKHQYSNNLDRFYEEYTFPEWVNAAHESAELVRIYEGLNGHADQSLISRIRDSLKGHELFVFDNNDRSGRDFSFELSVASKFASRGLFVDFGHDADLRVTYDWGVLFVECKRPKSATKVQRRIKDGLRQLHKRYVKSDMPSKARGILALSVGKLLNNELGLLEATDSKELSDIAFAHNAAFIEKHKKIWQENVDKRTLGVTIILDTPGVLKDSQQLTTCHEVTMNNSVLPYTNNYRLMLDIARDVFAANSTT